MSEPLIDKTDEQLLQMAEEALKGIFAAIDAGDWDIDHVIDCPEDSTCECVATKVAKTASDTLNVIEYRLRFSRGKRVAERGFGAHTAHKVKQLKGNTVEMECGFTGHHERFFSITQERRGVVLHRGDIPGCLECFPAEQADYLPPGTHLTIHGSLGRDGKRIQHIGCMQVGHDGWTLRGANKTADEGDPGAIVEVIKRRDCPTHGIGGEEGHTEEDFGPGGEFADA